MDTRTTYCPGCAHKVRLVVTDAPPVGGQSALPDGSDLVCLDFGQDCSEGKCPLTGRPGIVMGVRLARSHLREERDWETIHAECEGCGQVAELEVLDDRYAFCPLCSTTNRWTVLKLDDETEIAVTGV